MEQVALPMLAKWESFYVIVGSSAGALTGLQFVVSLLESKPKPLKGRQYAHSPRRQLFTSVPSC
jgi:hypothetical protein